MLDRIQYEDFGPDEAKLNLDIEFNMLNVFAGKNGSGKTLVFKSAWFMSFTLELYKTMLLMKIEGIDEVFKAEAELVFDMTFTSSERLSGACMISDKDEAIYKYSCVIDEGQIATFNIDVLDLDKFKAGEIRSVKYNSKEARTFSQYEKYLRFKDKLDIELTSMAAISEFKGFFMLYDMLWFEQLKSVIDQHIFTGGKEGPLERIFSLWDTHLGGNTDTTQPLPYAKDMVFKDSMIYIDNDDVKMKSLADYDLGTQSLFRLTMSSGV